MYWSNNIKCIITQVNIVPSDTISGQENDAAVQGGGETIKYWDQTLVVIYCRTLISN